MLQSTFSHIPRIGETTEKKLWGDGIFTWDDFCEHYEKLKLPNMKKLHILNHLEQSFSAYEKKDHVFFATHLPMKLHWRAYEDFLDHTCFLDIETTGLSKEHDDVTVVGLFDGKQSRIFVQGRNMHLLFDEIKKYSSIVSFNGRCFDIPFLKAKFPQVKFDQLHIDLRFVMKQLGYGGGLKRIERMLGIHRDDDLGDIDGYEAVRLWYQYLRGNMHALDILIRYNKADIENLKSLMEFAFTKLKAKTKEEMVKGF